MRLIYHLARAPAWAAAQKSGIYRGTPEAMVASLENAELQQEAERDEASLVSLRQALREAGPPELFSNPWISLDEFRQRILAAYQRFVAAGKFDRAIELCPSLTPTMPRWRAVELQADKSSAAATLLANCPTTTPSHHRTSPPRSSRCSASIPRTNYTQATVGPFVSRRMVQRSFQTCLVRVTGTLRVSFGLR